jgi:hypothetical protein
VDYISVERDPYTFRGVFRPHSGRIVQVWGWRLLNSSENHGHPAVVWNTLEALAGVSFIHVFAAQNEKMQVSYGSDLDSSFMKFLILTD